MGSCNHRTNQLVLGLGTPHAIKCVHIKHYRLKIGETRFQRGPAPFVFQNQEIHKKNIGGNRNMFWGFQCFLKMKTNRNVTRSWFHPPVHNPPTSSRASSVREFKQSFQSSSQASQARPGRPASQASRASKPQASRHRCQQFFL